MDTRRLDELRARAKRRNGIARVRPIGSYAIRGGMRWSVDGAAAARDVNGARIRNEGMHGERPFGGRACRKWLEEGDSGVGDRDDAVTSTDEVAKSRGRASTGRQDQPSRRTTLPVGATLADAVAQPPRPSLAGRRPTVRVKRRCRHRRQNMKAAARSAATSSGWPSPSRSNATTRTSGCGLRRLARCRWLDSQTMQDRGLGRVVGNDVSARRHGRNLRRGDCAAPRREGTEWRCP